MLSKRNVRPDENVLCPTHKAKAPDVTGQVNRGEIGIIQPYQIVVVLVAMQSSDTTYVVHLWLEVKQKASSILVSGEVLEEKGGA